MKKRWIKKIQFVDQKNRIMATAFCDQPIFNDNPIDFELRLIPQKDGSIILDSMRLSQERKPAPPA